MDSDSLSENKGSTHQIHPIWICIACVFVVFVLNALVPSLINGLSKNDFSSLIDNEHATMVFEGRYNLSYFRARPFVLEFQRLLNTYLDFPYQLSFNVINFIFLGLFFICTSYFPIVKQSNRLYGLPIIFMVLMPVLFAYLPSVWTYDDMVQYVLLWLFLYYLFEHKLGLSVLFLSIACIARETSLLFYLIVLSFYWIEVEKPSWKHLILWSIPVLTYTVFLKFYLPHQLFDKSNQFLLSTRFIAWTENFKNHQATRETITIVVTMVVPFFYFLVIKYQNSKQLKLKRWSLVLMAFILINCLVVCVTGLAREFRLFMLPLLPILPFIYHDVMAAIKNVIRHRMILGWQLILLVLFSFVFSFWFYTPKFYNIGVIFQMYIFAYFSLFSVVAFNYYLLKTEPNVS